MHARILSCLLLLPVLALTAEGPAREGGIIVAAGGYWRQHVTIALPLISTAEAKAAGIEADVAARTLKNRAGRKSRFIAAPSVPPSTDWMTPEFDDGEWVRVKGGFGTARQEVSLLCRRSRFRVTDPKRVWRLTLAARFRGGIVVYLNGTEICRDSLPAGKLTPGTPAADYPHDAFFVRSGARKGKTLHHWNDRALKAQFALQNRVVGPIRIPVALLKKGVNVLAVEVHRSDYPAACRTAGVGQFATIGLSRLFLRAEADAGSIQASVSRPAGFQVWNADVNDEVFDLSWGDSGEAPAPIRIVAVRNGRFGGQVVVSSDAPIEGLRATVGAMKQTDGKHAIPASAVSISYGLPTSGKVSYDGGTVYGGPTGVSLTGRFRRFDGLANDPPATIPLGGPGERVHAGLRAAWGLPAAPTPGAVCPVRVTVTVPGDAAAGRYAGSLVISAKGQQPVTAPIELTVHDWALPDVKDYVGQMSIYQSPDTLAAMYEVPLWSEAHWRLIERSVRLIGEAGNHTIILPLLSKEQAGNEQSYVIWVPKKGGGYTVDMTVLDRYLDVFLTHHDPKRIAAVCLIVWGNAGLPQGNPYQREKYDQNGLVKGKTRGTFTVTARDPKTGELTDMPIPKVGSPEYEAFWRPVLLDVRARLKQRGLEGKMVFGMPADPHPIVAAVATFRKICPDVGWFIGNHPGSTSLSYDRSDRKKRVPVVHVERVYTGPIPDPAVKRQFGWQRKQMALAFNRYGFGPLCLYPRPGVYAFRLLMEADLASGHRGAGRIGADYFAMGGGRRSSGSGGTFYSRYPGSGTGQTGLGANCRALLAAGPAGPVTSMRFENVREGLQTAEAVVFLQKALLDRKVTGPLADRCWALLDERSHTLRIHLLGLGRRGWQERNRRLFSAASEVAAALSTGGDSGP